MALAGPSKGDITRGHLGNWRAMCKCGELDGPERDDGVWVLRVPTGA
jgi:hypothetical protein